MWLLPTREGKQCLKAGAFRNLDEAPFTVLSVTRHFTTETSSPMHSKGSSPQQHQPLPSDKSRKSFIITLTYTIHMQKHNIVCGRPYQPQITAVPRPLPDNGQPTKPIHPSHAEYGSLSTSLIRIRSWANPSTATRQPTAFSFRFR